jgi:hypothetical protein
MENKELILKAVQYVNDFPARIEEFLKLEDEHQDREIPRFKVGDWVIEKHWLNPCRVIESSGNSFVLQETVSMNSARYEYSFADFRLCTSSEIKAHLIEVANQY